MSDKTYADEATAWLYESEDGSKELVLDCNGELARRFIELGWTETPLFAALKTASPSPSDVERIEAAIEGLIPWSPGTESRRGFPSSNEIARAALSALRSIKGMGDE